MARYVCLKGSYQYLPKNFKYIRTYYSLDPSNEIIELINNKNVIVLANKNAIPVMKILAEMYGISIMVPHNPKPIDLKKDDEVICITKFNNHLEINMFIVKEDSSFI